MAPNPIPSVPPEVATLQLPADLPPGVDRAEAEELLRTVKEGRTSIARLNARVALIERGVFPDETFFPREAPRRRGAEPVLSQGVPRQELRIVGEPVPSEPRNLDAEMGLIAGMIRDPGLIPELLAIAAPDDYAGDAQRWLAQAVATLQAEGKRPDRVLLAERIATDPDAARCGAEAALDLALRPGEAADAATLRSYAEIVAGKAVARTVEDYGREVARLARSGSLDPAALLERVEGRLSTLAPSTRDWEPPLVDGQLPAVPFPLDVLPAALADLAREVSSLTCCPVELFLLPCLTFVGSVVGNSVGLWLKPRWVEAPNLWTAYVLPRGNGKTAALMQAAEPLMKIFRELLEDHRLQIERRKDLKREWEAARRAKGGGVPPPDELEEPEDSLRRLVVNDVTWEALGPILSNNPRGVAVFQDELAGWLNGMNQYKSGKGNDLENWVSAWSRAPILVDRKGQEGQIPIVIQRPFVAVTGGIQPGKLSLMKRSVEEEDGFLDRLLFAFPDPVPQCWNEDLVSKTAYKQYEEMIRRLWDRPFDRDDDGQPSPTIVRLDTEAKAVWVAWYDRISAEFSAADFPEHLRGAWSKCRIHCARLALILDLLHRAYNPRWNGRPGNLTRTSVEGAIRLVEYFQAHFRRVFATIMGEKHEHPAARAILDWIVKGDRRRFSESDVKDNFRRGFADNPGAIAEGLAWLVERRCIRRAAPPREARGRGRTPLPRYEVNPSLLRGRAPESLESAQVQVH